jgi:hypothetical protein
MSGFWVGRDFEYVGILSVRDFEIRDFEGEPFPQTHFNQPEILTQKGSNYNPTKKSSTWNDARVSFPSFLFLHTDL